MKRGSKYLGKIYDGRWKVIDIYYPYKDVKNQRYILENIYNQMKVSVGARTLKNINKGLTTIYKTMWKQRKNK